jgi:DNA-binding response OmpR family regulator
MRMLIAEDDLALGIFLQRGLEADGHQVRVVQDGMSAVNFFRAECPELTILDLNLPKKDGESALDEIRQLNADVPILVLTGRQDLQSRVRCLEHGADDLMVKPFSFIELRARCRALMRRKTGAAMLLRTCGLEVNRMERSASAADRASLLRTRNSHCLSSSC